MNEVNQKLLELAQKISQPYIANSKVLAIAIIIFSNFFRLTNVYLTNLRYLRVPLDS
jgi:hypothetical protein